MRQSGSGAPNQASKKIKLIFKRTALNVQEFQKMASYWDWEQKMGV
jgi:hypothetical protein